MAENKPSVWSRMGAGLKEMFKRLPFAFYILAHPIQGFYDLKNDPKRRNLPGAIFLFLVCALTTVMKRQMVGYLFTQPGQQENLNLVYEVLVCLLPYIMFSISNWCFTSLMDGDGKFGEILTFTGYSTITMSMCNLIAIPVSLFASQDEAGIYNFFVAFGFVWCYGMIFLGMIETHQYSVAKAIGTTILTILGMCVIAFLIVLVAYLVTQVVGFIVNLYSEIAFRLNE